jgi:carbamoyltransferase
LIPAVTHVDGSCRVQTVSREQNPAYYDLIEAFGELTGCSLLLNTSFNDRGEPIVETYEDAVSCFLRTGLDGLIVEDQLIEQGEDTPPVNQADWEAETMERSNRTYNRMIEKYCNPMDYVELANKLRNEGR